MNINIVITEVERDKKYNVKCAGKLIYTVERDARVSDKWAVMPKGSKEIIFNDQYRIDLFERLIDKIKLEIRVKMKVTHMELEK